MKRQMIIFEDSSKVSFGGGQKGTLEVIKGVNDIYDLVIFDTNKLSKFQNKISSLKRKYLFSYSRQLDTEKSSFSASKIEIIVFPIFIFLNFFKVLIFLLRTDYIKKNVILYTNSKKNLILLYLLHLTTGYKFVYHARTLDDENSRWFFVIKTILRRASLVICVSEVVRQSFALNNSTVVYNSVGNYPELSQCNVRTSSEKFRIGFVGELLNWKGINVFGDISECLHDKDVEFHAYGAGSNQAALSRRFPKVIFHGFVNEMAEIYGSVDLVVSTSVAPESFGRTTLEAASFGVPCVSSALGGQIELIESGKFGILVEAGNSVEFAKEIVRLKQDLKMYRNLSENGLEFSKLFTTAIFYKKFYAAMESI